MHDNYLTDSFGFWLVEGFLPRDRTRFVYSGRVADVVVLGKKLLLWEEVHPAVLTNFSLEMPTSCFELDLTLLHSL